MADEAFSLRDAIALYSGKIDLSHKLWTYLQIVAFAAMGFAWSGDRPTLVLAPLLVAFVVFAVVNGFLLVTTQGEAVEIESAIESYREEHDKEIEKELRPALDTFHAWQPWQVGLVHGLIDVVAVGAIVVQLGVHCGWWVNSTP
jgi:hypothetical protein